MKKGVTRSAKEEPETAGAQWTFFTNHAHVLIVLAQSPNLTTREIGELVGITERAVQKIIADLEQEGYLSKNRVGRNNEYRLSLNRPLRHPIERHRRIGDIVGLIVEG